MEDYSVSPGRVLRKRRYSVLRFVLRTQLLKRYTGVVVDVKFCYTTLCLRVIVFLNANKREGNLPRERRFGFFSSPYAHEEKTEKKNLKNRKWLILPRPLCYAFVIQQYPIPRPSPKFAALRTPILLTLSISTLVSKFSSPLSLHFLRY